MEEEINDQVPELDPTESSDAEASTDNQEEQGEEQSNQDEKTQEAESKLYKLPDGREVTADDLHKEYAENLLPEFTRRSQRLKELEAQAAQRKAEVESQTREATDEVLKKVPADVKEAITRIVEPLFDQKLSQIEEANRQKQEEKEREEADRRFQSELGDLEKKYDGKKSDILGIPKFDRREVLKAMQDPNNKIFDPELKFMDMHRAKFLDLEVKKALKQQKGGNRTEATGSAGASEKGGSQGGKSPRTIREASESFLQRLSSIE